MAVHAGSESVLVLDVRASDIVIREAAGIRKVGEVFGVSHFGRLAEYSPHGA